MAGFSSSADDARDWEFSAPEPLYDSGRVVLRVPFRRNQGSVPCCVSIAVATCMETLDQATPPAVKLAPLFNYYQTRLLESDDASTLADVQPRSALLSATRDGICRAGAHPAAYTEAGALLEPDAAALEQAREQRILITPASGRALWFERLTRTDRAGEWRAALAGGLPVLFGFWLTESYWSWRDLGLSTLPVLRADGAEGETDGHCVTAFGYDDSAILVQDSRGPRFASKGCWRLPYALLDSTLVAEAWVIRRITYDQV